MKVKLPYGLTADNDRLVLPNGQLSVDIESKAMRLHNGVTSGGIEIPSRQAFAVPELNWTLRSENLNGTIYNVAWGGGRWVAVDSQGFISTSVNGFNWSAINPGLQNAVNSVAYGNGLWVIGGGSGRMATSPDGLTWTSRTSGFGNVSIMDIKFNGIRWVAVGGSGQIAWSDNGIDWNHVQTLFVEDGLITVTYEPSIGWVVGTNKGRIYTSPDGITWVLALTIPDGRAIDDIEHHNGLFAVVASSGLILTGTDLNNLVIRDAGFGVNPVTGVAYGNGVWVAVGYGGRYAVSPNGITWASILNAPGVATPNAIAYGDGHFVTAGQSGQLASTHS